MHFTPTSGSWLNMVEIFFGIITRQAIRRGTFTSVKDLIAAIETYIDGWNERCQPFTWTKTADEILATSKRKHPGTTSHCGELAGRRLWSVRLQNNDAFRLGLIGPAAVRIAAQAA